MVQYHPFSSSSFSFWTTFPASRKPGVRLARVSQPQHLQYASWDKPLLREVVLHVETASDLYLLHAKSTLSFFPRCDNKKYLQTLLNVSRGAKLPLVENHWSKDIVKFNPHNNSMKKN